MNFFEKLKYEIGLNDEFYNSFISAEMKEKNPAIRSLEERFYAIIEKYPQKVYYPNEKRDVEYDLILEKGLYSWNSPSTLYYFCKGNSTGIRKIRENDGSYITKIEKFSKLKSDELKHFKYLINYLENKLNKKLIFDKTWSKLKKEVLKWKTYYN